MALCDAPVEELRGVVVLGERGVAALGVRGVVALGVENPSPLGVENPSPRSLDVERRRAMRDLFTVLTRIDSELSYEEEDTCMSCVI